MVMVSSGKDIWSGVAMEKGSRQPINLVFPFTHGRESSDVETCESIRNSQYTSGVFNISVYRSGEVAASMCCISGS